MIILGIIVIVMGLALNNSVPMTKSRRTIDRLRRNPLRSIPLSHEDIDVAAFPHLLLGPYPLRPRPALAIPGASQFRRTR
jgi:hypothetical protein